MRDPFPKRGLVHEYGDGVDSGVAQSGRSTTDHVKKEKANHLRLYTCLYFVCTENCSESKHDEWVRNLLNHESIAHFSFVNMTCF